VSGDRGRLQAAAATIGVARPSIACFIRTSTRLFEIGTIYLDSFIQETPSVPQRTAKLSFIIGWGQAVPSCDIDIFLGQNLFYTYLSIYS
jgi:hypothetical protein